MKNILTIVATALAVPAYIIGAYWIRAFVICKLWTWYVLDFGLPQISMTQAVGIMMVLYAITHNAKPYKKKADEDSTDTKNEWKDIVIHGISEAIAPFGTLLVGYIAKFWFN